jgi:sugar phosphate isomerase/epimerase
MDVRFGICTDLDKISSLSEAGFDYIELTTYIFTLAPEDEFAAMRKTIARSGVSCEACNLFYPLDFHVTGKDINIRKIYDYIDEAVERAAVLGVRNITIGSGPARRVPEGFPKKEAFLQFGDQIHHAGELAAKYDMTVTVEPIRPVSTNLIINLAEGTALVKHVNLPNVKTMADINQMTGAGDTIDMIYQYGNYVKHLHTIDTKNHCYPINPEDAEQIALIKAYLTVNPGGRITVEGVPFTTVENAQQCLAALKNYVEKAYN